MTEHLYTAQAKPPPKSQSALQFDWQDWLPYFDDDDATPAQKQELIETLWGIVCSFVDLGWDLNPNAEICGHQIDLTRLLQGDVVDSKEHPTVDFAVVAQKARKEDAA